jgi:hypothetical protein
MTMKIRLALALTLFCTTAVAASAQSKPAGIDGKWNMTVNGPDGQPMQVAAVFKTIGKKLTGSLTSPQGEVPLEGEVDGAKIAFGITVPQDSGPMNIGFAGTLQQDGTLTGTASGPFGELKWKAERAKD